MKADETFVRELEAFFDQKFNDYTKNRIHFLLSEYRTHIPPVIKEVVVRPPVKRRPKSQYKEFVTNSEMLDIADEMCRLYGIEKSEFFNRDNRRASSFVVEVRRNFCQRLYEDYLCNNSVLADFIGVDHSTICFYLYGKNRYEKNQNNI